MSQGPLGTWVTTQRQAYKKGKLSEELILTLDDLGFSWVVIPNSKRAGVLTGEHGEERRLWKLLHPPETNHPDMYLHQLKLPIFVFGLVTFQLTANQSSK